jgi:hypothetical protein
MRVTRGADMPVNMVAAPALVVIPGNWRRETFFMQTSPLFHP